MFFERPYHIDLLLTFNVHLFASSDKFAKRNKIRLIMNIMHVEMLHIFDFKNIIIICHEYWYRDESTEIFVADDGKTARNVCCFFIFRGKQR